MTRLAAGLWLAAAAAAITGGCKARAPTTRVGVTVPLSGPLAP